MAEVLGLAASVTALLQLSAQVARYAASAHGAPKERRRFLVGLRQCEFFLQQLKDEIDDIDEGKLWKKTMQALEDGSGLKPLEEALEFARKKLKPPEGGLKSVIAGLRWPFQVGELNWVLSIIDRQRGLVSLAVLNNHLEVANFLKGHAVENKEALTEIRNAVKNIQESQQVFQVLGQYILDGQTRNMLNWLWPHDYSRVYADNLDKCQEGTLRWILAEDKFVNWLGGGSKVLWCWGIPGAGKSVAASFVSCYLQANKAGADVGVATIIFDYRTSISNEDVLLSVSRQLLEQYLRSHKALPPSLAKMYSERSRDGNCHSLDQDAIAKVLSAVATLFTTVFIVIDALDEHGENSQQTIIRKVLGLSFPDCRLFVTSRWLPRIQALFRDYPEIPIKAKSEDIETLIQTRIPDMDRLSKQVEKHPKLKAEIVDHISRKADGMFLLAALHLDSLEHQHSLAGIRRALMDLPTTLKETYNRIISRIMSHSSQDDTVLALRVLSWIALSFRPLSVVEIQHAIATIEKPVGVAHDRVGDDELPDVNIILSVCAGLVELRPDPDQKTKTFSLRFVHYTTQEYLRSTIGEWHKGGQALVAKTCLQYLSLDCFGSGACSSVDQLEARLGAHSLYEYAARHWGHHVFLAGTETELAGMALGLLQDGPKLSAALQAMLTSSSGEFLGYGKLAFTEMTPLHLATFFGLADVAAILVQGGSEDVNARDFLGRTALWWAAAKGHRSIVNLLLATPRLEVNIQDSDGTSALHRAVRGQHGNVLAALLRRKELDVNTRDHSKRTPLHFAVRWGKGQVAIARQLVAAGADANARDEFGNTAMGWAAELGQTAVVALLVESGVDVNARDVLGMTALCWAAFSGHVELANWLLARVPVVQVNARDEEGQSPLLVAAKKDHIAVVRLLLKQRTVDVNARDHLGRAPLWWAAQRGDLDLVRLLMTREELDLDCKDSWNQTPLSQAQGKGFLEIARLIQGGKKPRE